MENPIIIYVLIGIIVFLSVFIVVITILNNHQQKTLLKAILSKDVHEFKAATEQIKEDSSQNEDKLIPLSELSDEEFDKLILNAEQ